MGVTYMDFENRISSSKMSSPGPVPPTVARKFMADLQAYYAE
jgi:hypothetical protein